MPGIGDGGLSLLFAKGQRPSRDDLARLAAARVAPGAGGFSLGHDFGGHGTGREGSGREGSGRYGNSKPGTRSQVTRKHPGQDDTGQLELVASGLTFELSGLHPAPPAPPPVVHHRFGADEGAGLTTLEAVALLPGDHIAGGQVLMPVVRTMLALACRMAELPGLSAIVWHPAHSLIGPGLFRRQVDGWLGGGAFPALGLTALIKGADGTVRSHGLAHFIGQELALDPSIDGGAAAAARVAVRLIHALVEDGPLQAPIDVEGPDGQPLHAAPENAGRLVHVTNRRPV